VLDDSVIVAKENQEKTKWGFWQIDVTSQQIINILEEYVKPAVAADGNIIFDSYNEKDKVVKVILQGACSGCFINIYFKIGCENMLKAC
jgi:Fe-S cluster biogenesis protein NfuA